MTVEFENEVVEFGKRGFGNDCRCNTFNIAVRAVAKFFNLFFGIDLRELVEVELSGATFAIGKNVDFGELGFELI